MAGAALIPLIILWHLRWWEESPGAMWGGSRSLQTERVPAGGVARRGVPTHQRRLCLLNLHRTLVELCRLLKVTFFVAEKTKTNV